MICTYLRNDGSSKQTHLRREKSVPKETDRMEEPGAGGGSEISERANVLCNYKGLNFQKTISKS